MHLLCHQHLPAPTAALPFHPADKLILKCNLPIPAWVLDKSYLAPPSFSSTRDQPELSSVGYCRQRQSFPNQHFSVCFPCTAWGSPCSLRDTAAGLAHRITLRSRVQGRAPIPVPEVIIFTTPAPEGIRETIDLLKLLNSQAAHPTEELVVREPK